MLTGVLIIFLFIGVVLLAMTSSGGEHSTAPDDAARGYLQLGAVLIICSAGFGLLCLHVPWQAIVVGIVTLIVCAVAFGFFLYAEGMGR